MKLIFRICPIRINRAYYITDPTDKDEGSYMYITNLFVVYMPSRARVGYEKFDAARRPKKL